MIKEIAMVGIVIALCLFTVGKIHSQDTVVSLTVETRRPFSPIPHRDPSQHLQPPSSRLFHNCGKLTNCQADNPRGENTNFVDHPPSHTGKINQARPQLFMSRIVPEKMDKPLIKNSSNPNATMHGRDVLEKIDSAEKKPAGEDDLTPASVSQNVTPNSTIEVTQKSITATVAIPVNVTLDERSSFDGDQCPTGYVKIDGKCVEKD